MIKFIERAKKVHKDVYNYSMSEYINMKTKVIIGCSKHGFFLQSPHNHLNGAGCPKCAGKNKTTKDVVKEFIKIHGDNYNYDKFIYENAIKKGIIICPIHKEFLQSANAHLSGKGCSKCAGKNKTTEQFIQEAKIKHNDKYIYDNVVYKKANLKVEIICPIHGSFWLSPNCHLRSQGCNKCSVVSLQAFIIRYGEQKGKEKYEEMHQKIKNTYKNMSVRKKKKLNKSKGITLQNFIKKYGKEKGIEKYEQIIKNRKLGRSKISQKLFWELFNILKLDSSKTYFSELNHEYYINDTVQKKFYFLDFVYKKKCIEFNGDRWHANPNKYKAEDCPAPFGEIKKTSKQVWEQDEQKYQSIRDRGFQVLVVWQSEFKKQQNEIIKKCIDFLTKE